MGEEDNWEENTVGFGSINNIPFLKLDVECLGVGLFILFKLHMYIVKL